MTNLNYYNDEAEFIMQSSEATTIIPNETKHLNQKGDLTTAKRDYDYTPASVAKSNSLASDEYLTSRSSFDDTPSTSGVCRPSCGLKIVFKRQSENNYEIKNCNTGVDENNNEISVLHDQKQIANVPVKENEYSNGKRRPKRQAARKVKFIFSDDEENNYLQPVKKKQLKKTNTKSPNSTTSPPPAEFKSPVDCEQQFPSQITPMLQNYLSNTLPLYQQQYLTNPMLMLQQHYLKSQPSVYQNPNTSSRPLANKKRPTRRRKQLPTQLVQNTKPDKSPATPAPTNKKVVYKQFREEKFSSGEIVRSTLFEKHDILNNQPSVVINHSVPMPIALVEDKTNIVQTKAVLFIHLFKSLSSQCIGCPLCKKFLTISEFSKHIHPDEDDELLDEAPQNDPLKKSYKILPYRMNDLELSESDLNTWKLFGKRYSLFKQKSSQSPGVVEKPKIDQPIETKVKLTTTLQDQAKSTSDQPSTLEKLNLKKIHFDDWDYKENQSFLLSQERFESDQVCVVDTVPECKPNGEIHYFMEQSEDLLLSEDESDNQEVSHEEPMKESFKIPPETTNQSISNSDQKTLSLSENEASAQSPTSSNQIKPIDIFDPNDVIPITNSEIQTAQEIAGSNKTALPAILVKQNSIELNKVKNKLLTNRLSYDDTNHLNSDQKPTLIERYFNLYDNLSNDVLLYICDNEFTIIPDTYILYINNKRELNEKRLKLADTDYYQLKWLQTSLDLACKN